MPFLTIGSFIFGLFGKHDPSDKSSKLLGIGALILGVLLIGGIVLKIHDHNIISAHDDHQKAVIANAVVSADRAANADKTVRDQDFANSQANVAGAMANATQNDPAHGATHVGPVQQSYFDSVRRERDRKARP